MSLLNTRNVPVNEIWTVWWNGTMDNNGKWRKIAELSNSFQEDQNNVEVHWNVDDDILQTVPVTNTESVTTLVSSEFETERHVKCKVFLEKINGQRRSRRYQSKFLQISYASFTIPFPLSVGTNCKTVDTRDCWLCGWRCRCMWVIFRLKRKALECPFITVGYTSWQPVVFRRLSMLIRCLFIVEYAHRPLYMHGGKQNIPVCWFIQFHSINRSLSEQLASMKVTHCAIAST